MTAAQTKTTSYLVLIAFAFLAATAIYLNSHLMNHMRLPHHPSTELELDEIALRITNVEATLNDILATQTDQIKSNLKRIEQLESDLRSKNE